MLLHADVKGLELVTAAYLSRDPVMMAELSSNFDIHADNQARLRLPDRLTAKTFVFKLIYGGTGFGFANQVEFQHISTDPKYWDSLINAFLEKYQGLRDWREELVRTVCSTGRLVMPTGREFHYPVSEVLEKLWYWKPKIYNYPVQGTGADLVCIGRVSAWERLRGTGVLWLSTVHDSIDLDIPNGLCYNNICTVVNESIQGIPSVFESLFGQPFDLPINAEIFLGPTLGDLVKWPIELPF